MSWLIYVPQKKLPLIKPIVMGFFRGFISYHKIIQPKTCFPVGSTLGQIVKVFLRYADTHPEELHMDSFVLIIFALNDAWPCEKND